MFKEPWEAAPKAAKPAKAKIRGAGQDRSPQLGDARRQAHHQQCLLRVDRGGQTDAEIWSVIQPQFGLSDSKKNYPKLNRRTMGGAAACGLDGSGSQGRGAESRCFLALGLGAALPSGIVGRHIGR